MKSLARELTWFFIAIFIAIPLAFLFLFLMNLQPQAESMNHFEEIFEMELFIIGAALGFLCAYLIRLIIWAVAKTLVSE